MYISITALAVMELYWSTVDYLALSLSYRVKTMYSRGVVCMADVWSAHEITFADFELQNVTFI